MLDTMPHMLHGSLNRNAPPKGRALESVKSVSRLNRLHRQSIPRLHPQPQTLTDSSPTRCELSVLSGDDRQNSDNVLNNEVVAKLVDAENGSPKQTSEAELSCITAERYSDVFGGSVKGLRAGSNPAYLTIQPLNLLAMVRRRSQAEHKCPLERGSQGLRWGLGLLSPEDYNVVVKAVGQNSIASNTGRIKSPYRVTALNDYYSLNKKHLQRGEVYRQAREISANGRKHHVGRPCKALLFNQFITEG